MCVIITQSWYFPPLYVSMHGERKKGSDEDTSHYAARVLLHRALARDDRFSPFFGYILFSLKDKRMPYASNSLPQSHELVNTRSLRGFMHGQINKC